MVITSLLPGFKVSVTPDQPPLYINTLVSPMGAPLSTHVGWAIRGEEHNKRTRRKPRLFDYFIPFELI
jgi:hypothetical protein